MLNNLQKKFNSKFLKTLEEYVGLIWLNGIFKTKLTLIFLSINKIYKIKRKKECDRDKNQNSRKFAKMKIRET